MRKFTNGMMAAGAMIALGLPSIGHADVVVRGQEGKPLDEIRKAPGSIYPDLQTIVAQPSTVSGIGESEVAFGLIVPLTIELGDGFGLGLNAAVGFTRAADPIAPFIGVTARF